MSCLEKEQVSNQVRTKPALPIPYSVCLLRLHVQKMSNTLCKNIRVCVEAEKTWFPVNKIIIACTAQKCPPQLSAHFTVDRPEARCPPSGTVL